MYSQISDREREARLESIKQELNKQISELLRSRANLEQLPELFSLNPEEYIKITPVKGRGSKKSGDIKQFDIKKFIQDVSVKQLESLEVVTLPEQVFTISDVIMPTDKFGGIESGSGAGIEEKDVIPRTEYVMEFLSNNNIVYKAIFGKPDERSMRKKPYVAFSLPEFNAIIFVNNEEGNATRVVFLEQEDKEINVEDLLTLTKSEIDTLPEIKVQKIVWPGSKEAYHERLMDVLSDPRAESNVGKGRSTERNTKVEKSNVIERAPEGWKTKKSLEGITGKSYLWIKRWFKNHPDKSDFGKYYLDSTNKKSIHYPPEVVEAIQKDTKNLPDNAPRFWKTIGELHVNTGKGHRWIQKWLRDNPKKAELGKHYLDSGNRKLMYYPPEVVEAMQKDIENLPDYAPEGWMTVYRLGLAVGKREHWIRKWLGSNPSSVKLGKNYLDPMNKESMYYPPEVLEAMKKDLAENN